MTVNWAGRTFGQLTPAEKREVTRDAAERLAAELTAAAEQISAVLDQELPGDTGHAIPAGQWRECENGSRVATCYHNPRCGPFRPGQRIGERPFGRYVSPAPTEGNRHA
jgi:hypothetical protein